MGTEHKIKTAFDEVKASELTKKRAEVAVKKATCNYGADRSARKHRSNRIAACIAALLLTASAFTSYFAPATVIALDVNPSVIMKVNVFDRVISLEGLNPDGEELVSPLKLSNMPYVRAMRRLLLSEGMTPYIDNDSMFSITVVGSGAEHTEEILANVACCTLSVAEKENVYYCTVDTETARVARQNGLTPARYQALEMLQENDPSITAETVQQMSMREIRELLSSKQLENPCEKANLN